MKTIRLISILSCMSLLLFVQCKKEINNPFDSACPPDIWTPVSFSATQSGLTVQLTWVQDITHIDGFKLDRRVTNGEWITIASPGENASSFTDSNLGGSKLHEYRLYAVAGNNQSNMALAQLTPVFADGTTSSVAYNGHTYKSVWIDNREWMAENLRTLTYRDGSNIPSAFGNTEWASTSNGAYTIYPHASISGLNSNNDVLNAYGALYNWFAVNDSRGLCPAGWRAATNTEFELLRDHLGGADIAGGKLKSLRTAPAAHPRWDSPNTGAADAVGYSALPGGLRDGSGSYNFAGLYGMWWSGTEQNSDLAYAKAMISSAGNMGFGPISKKTGAAVRCIRD
jgi:uncharacterized protein (TIGR02145 family)